MFLDGAKLHQPGRILLPVSSSRTGCPIARSAEELSSTWPRPADITVDLDHRPNWTERIVALRLRPTVGDLSLATAEDCEFTELRVAQHGELADGPSAYSVHQWQKHEAEQRLIIAHNMRFSLDSALGRPALTLGDLLPRWFAITAKYGPVLDLVFSLRPGIGYLESNVFAIASSLEGIHRKLFQGASKRTATQKERLESICRAAPPEHREWLLRALAHSHEPSFPERIRQLVEHAGEAVAYQLGDLDMWTGLVGKARNNIAHARGLSAADVVGTVRLMQSMQMLAEVILVREIGISKDQCADLIKGDFEWRQVRPE